LARKVLLADDSVTAQNMGRRILSDAGYEVITVNNGSAALKKIAESKPDLIILDVYMPGYGGLEVCQRLKEAPETARIPVLLSVGKLEPFRVDEARRVRADGHIIKPFEASELLTALTKLEDKIVPQAESFKPGRFAKAIASAEQLSTASQGVGDDAGWKSRLAIPARKPAETETQGQQDEAKAAAVKSAAAAVTAALPQGITTEELAALAAAASAVANKNETAVSKSEEPEVSTVAKASTPVEEKLESVAVEVAEAATFASAAAAENEAPPEARRETLQTPAQAAELQRATTDAEVLAALASLSPAHGETIAAGESSSANGNGSGEPVALSASALGAERRAEAGASGPRWIAQSVAVAEDESTVVLEREMEKAYAAMAALEAEKTSSAAAATGASTPAESAPLPGAAPLSEISAPAAISTETTASQPALAIPVSDPQTAVVAESVPESSAPEAAAASEVPSPATDAVSAIGETSVAVSNEGAAYAAAASAGAGASEPGMQAESSAAPGVAAGVDSIAAAAEVDSGRESELAAAWQNWKQIRDSIVGSQRPQDVARATATAGPEDVRSEEPPSFQPAAETASDPGPSESAVIANIVDSVLAELKPKLMEEISKKMKKDKKK
jgi:CheY-like chemotaxis protein